MRNNLSIVGSADADAVSAEIAGSNEVGDGVLEVASAVNEVISWTGWKSFKCK